MSKRAIKKRLRNVGIISLVAMVNFLFPQHAQTLTASAAAAEIKPVLLQQAFPRIQVPAAQPGVLPKAADRSARKVITLTMTAYSSSVDETDGDPFTAASGVKVHDGMIAYNFLPFGTKIRIPEVYGDKIFTVEDRLNPRAGRYLADMWMPSKQQAKQWGARIVTIEIL